MVYIYNAAIREKVWLITSWVAKQIIIIIIISDSISFSTP